MANLVRKINISCYSLRTAVFTIYNSDHRSKHIYKQICLLRPNGKNYLGLESCEKSDLPGVLEDLISIALGGAVDDLEVVVHEEGAVLTRGPEVQKTKLEKVLAVLASQ